MKKVMVPGTFDPITEGHLDVIKRAATLFDEVLVGVAGSENKGKGPLFTLEERVELARAATSEMANVTVKPFRGLLVDFARQEGAIAIIKGLRAVTDFEWEFQQAALNYHMNPDMETMFIMASPEHMYLSSSVVKEIAGFGGDISTFVPNRVGNLMAERFGCVFRES